MRKLIVTTVAMAALSLWLCSHGVCQTWQNYVKEDGYGNLLVEGDYLWSAGAVLYRFDVNTPETTVYGRDDGLPENNLSCIAIDSRGIKWLGTASRGLWLFDGIAFRSFIAQQQLGKQNIGYLAVDGADNVWMAAAGSEGLNVWDGQLMRFYGAESGLEGQMRGIACDGNTAWCCTNKGIFRLQGQAWTKEREGWHFDPFFDSGGNLWALRFGGTAYGAVRFDGAQWSEFSLCSGFYTPGGLSEAPDGSIWVGIYNGVARFDGESWTNYTPGEGMPEEWPELGGIMSTAVDANNVLWATSSIGIIRCDGGTWSILPTAYSIPMGHLMAACWTPDGLLFHTYHGGRGFFDGISWETLRAESPGVAGRSSMLYDSARDRVWIASGAPLSFFDLALRAYFTALGDTVPLNATCMALDMADNLWVGTGSQGVYRLQGESWSRFTTVDGLNYDDVQGIGIAGNGDVWVWAGGPYQNPTIDVNIFSEGSWHQEALASEGTIMGLASDDQHSICAFIQTYPSYWAMRIAPDGTKTQWQLDVSIISYPQEMFVSPGGEVWIRGYFGALRFVEDEWRLVTPADGLAAGLIEYVAFAPHNETWVCTETALSRLDESPIPWLGLHLAGASGTTLDFVPGQTLSLYAELHNPMTQCDVSIYVAFQLPGDDTLFFWPTFSTDPAPAFTGALPDKLFWGPQSLFQYTFNGSQPAGEYFAKGAILSNETGQIIGEIIEQPFAFAP